MGEDIELKEEYTFKEAEVITSYKANNFHREAHVGFIKKIKRNGSTYISRRDVINLLWKKMLNTLEGKVKDFYVLNARRAFLSKEITKSELEEEVSDIETAVVEELRKTNCEPEPIIEEPEKEYESPEDTEEEGLVIAEPKRYEIFPEYQKPKLEETVAEAGAVVEEKEYGHEQPKMPEPEPEPAQESEPGDIGKELEPELPKPPEPELEYKLKEKIDFNYFNQKMGELSDAKKYSPIKDMWKTIAITIRMYGEHRLGSLRETCKKHMRILFNKMDKVLPTTKGINREILEDLIERMKE